MAISFYRAFFQTARVISQPAVKILKKVHIINPPINAYADFLVMFGRLWHRFERILNYKRGALVELTREAALTKGIENFYNIVFYCLFFMFPVGQIVGIWMQDRRNKRERQQKVKSIEGQILQLEQMVKRASRGVEYHLSQLLK